MPWQDGWGSKPSENWHGADRSQWQPWEWQEWQRWETWASNKGDLENRIAALEKAKNDMESRIEALEKAQWEAWEGHREGLESRIEALEKAQREVWESHREDLESRIAALEKVQWEASESNREDLIPDRGNRPRRLNSQGKCGTRLRMVPRALTELDSKSGSVASSENDASESEASPEGETSPVAETSPVCETSSSEVEVDVEAFEAAYRFFGKDSWNPRTSLEKDELKELLKDVERLGKALEARGMASFLEKEHAEGSFDAGHDSFHKSSLPRVGNWILALSGSLLGKSFIRNKYNNSKRLGKFCENVLWRMHNSMEEQIRQNGQLWVVLLLRLREISFSLTGRLWYEFSWRMTLQEFSRKLQSELLQSGSSP